MKKRIYLAFVGLVLLCALLLSLVFGLFFYNMLKDQAPVSGLGEVFAAMLPAAAAVTAFFLLPAWFAVRRLAEKIAGMVEKIDYAGSGAPVCDELLPYARKLERQKREIARNIAALEARTETIETVTGNMKEGLIVIDNGGTVLSANRSVLKIFHESGMAGKNILHICRETEFRQEIKRCLAGENLEMPFKRGGRSYNVFFSPVYSGGEINGAVILFLDATEKHQAEKQRREFSANVSHELKTPLTTISALSEMMENGMVRQEDVKDFAVRISGQARRLINIIDDIIRLSEFDEGRINSDHAFFDLGELAASVIAGLQEQARERNVLVQLIGGKHEISANRRMIDELLYNLVDNGIKYNKNGGQVTVTLSEENGFCKISVADAGIGIPKEHQTRVFERFYRVDKSRSKKTGGTGLGLSIVKHIVELHGGRIELESGENTGTTITCWLPKGGR